MNNITGNMMMNFYRLILLACGLLTTVPSISNAKEADQLFRSHDTLAVTISGPFATINKEREKEKRYPGAKLVYDDIEKGRIALNTKLEVRGNFRLRKKICRFPPLRLRFDKAETKGTLFHGQKKIKLVTACMPKSNRYQQYVFQEYLIYRMFNLLTDRSFKVRLAEVSYVDTPDGKQTNSGFGFFIEDKARMRKRLGMKKVEHHKVSFSELNEEQLALVSIFQFMIGNADWSALQGEIGESCCHNAVLASGEDDRYFVIPYDFDFTGLVNPSYAFPNKQLGQRTIKTRVYRGHCELNPLVDSTLQRFHTKRDDLYKLISEFALLNQKTVKKTLAYLDSFYRIIENEKQWKAKIIKRCR